ncbi:MAG TPA: hypothetical protein VFU26_12020 [Gaiellaceae bacterium]|nr:hypothetical protein [Gaiellaceae bacterium]
MRRALLGVALALWIVPAGHAAAPTRLIYTSDRTGIREVYSLDPSRPRRPAQLTFGHPAACEPLLEGCGYGTATPSPDGRWLAYGGSPYACAGAANAFVARADGRDPKALPRRPGECATAFVWAPNSKQLAYLSGGAVWSVRVPGLTARRIAAGYNPRWSPDSRSLAFVSADEQRSLEVWRAGRARTLAHDVAEFAWSPNGRWIALARGTYQPYFQEVKVVSPDGKHERQVSDSYGLSLSWSGDGRMVAFHGSRGLTVARIGTSSLKELGSVGYRSSWSHRGHLLALDTMRGVELYDAAADARRVLTASHATEVAWAPDDRALAFVVNTRITNFSSGDLKVVTTSGSVRTLLRASSDRGGSIGELSWIRPNRKLRYRPAEERRAATVSPQTLEAPWPIGRLAADGDRVAYTTCGHLFVWTPQTGSVSQVEPAASLTPQCTTSRVYNPFEIYDIALAGDRLAFGVRDGNMSQRWFLLQESLSQADSLQEVATGGGFAGCTVAKSGLGDLVGSGDSLFFSRWEEGAPPAPCGVAVKQDIYRLEPAGCECPIVASAPGPLQPSAVDQGRVVARGTNATLILDRNGNQLLSVPVHALAALLSAGDLVVLVRGQLRDYDSTTGALLHSWGLPDVDGGGTCGSPHPWACPQPPLTLQDAAGGLVAYVLDRQVHVLRLRDGITSTLGIGMMARFMESGLVYADGPRLRLVPFAQLP